MQQDADFITADFLYMFWASSAHHQEYKILTWQPPVQVVMVACYGWNDSFIHNMTEWKSTCNHNYLYRWLPCQYFILLMMGAWHPKHVEKVCSNKICILLHHVSVLFNLNLNPLFHIDPISLPLMWQWNMVLFCYHVVWFLSFYEERSFTVGSSTFLTK